MPLLTAAAVVKYKPTDTRREIPDTRAPGLRLIIQPKPSGTKSWAVRLRRPDGRTAKVTLGPVDTSDEENDEEPVLGAPLTLRAARQLANKIDRQRVLGKDVAEEYKVTQSRRKAAAVDAAANSFGKSVIEFFRDHKVRRWGTRPRRWRGDAAILGLRWAKGCEDPTKAEPEIIKGGLADTWGSKPLTNIDGHDVHNVVDSARKLGIPGLDKRNKDVSAARGRKMHAALSNFFKWAHRQRLVTVNPVVGVWSPGAPPARERVLTDEEIKAFWSATEKVADPVRSLLKVLLLTGQRVNEIKGMRYDELGGFIPDTVEAVWTIGGNRTKNHRPHSLHLPPLVRDIIAKLPLIEGSEFVFCGATGTTPATIGSKVKATLDEAMEAVAPWRFHDLRRTCASGMLRLGVRSEVVERTLNHVSGSFSGVAGTYMRDPLAEEVTAALLRWSQHVTGLLKGDDKVVPMQKPKR